MSAGKSVARVDAFDKVTGRAKYTDDLCDSGALVARVLHATIANGRVLRIDTSAAERIEGVVKIVTCLDVPDIRFPPAGHPWSTAPHQQDEADRKLLTDRVRIYGDDVAAVIAENEVAAAQALRQENANFTASAKSTSDVVKALSAPMLVDYMAIVMDKQALADRDFTMNVILPDVGEQHMLRVKNGVLLV